MLENSNYLRTPIPYNWGFLKTRNFLKTEKHTLENSVFFLQTKVCAAIEIKFI